MSVTTVPAQAQSAAIPRYTWYVIWLLFAVNMLNYIDRMVLAVLIESIRIDIPMTDTQIGILTGLAFAIFYAVAGLAIGRLADLFNRKKILIGAISVWSLATAVSGAAGSFVHLLAARLVVGTGEAGSTPCSQSLIADYCDYRQRPAAYAIFAAGGTVGLAVGLAGGGYIAEIYGWRMAFVAAGLCGLPVAILVALTLKEPVRGAQDTASDAMIGTSYTDTIRLLLARRSFPMLVLAASCTAFVMFGVAQWVPPFLIRAYGLSPSEVGLYFGIVMGLGSAVGAIAGGALCSALVARDNDWLLRLPMLVGLSVLPLYLVAFHAPSLGFALAMILGVNLIGSLAFGAMTAAMHSVVPAGMRGTATSVYGLVTSLLGIGFAPFFIGVMSDVFGGGAQDAGSLRLALSIAVFMSLGTVLFLYFAKRTLDADQVTTAGAAAGASAGAEA